MGRPPVQLLLTDTQRAEIKRRLRAGTTPQRDLIRLRIVLAAETARSAESIAAELGVARSVVERWRGRFAKGGLKALVDAPRSGRPSPLKPEQLLEIVAIACEPLPGDDGNIPKDGRTTRSIDDIIITAKERGVVESIGWGTVQRLLAKADVKPHRDQQWLHSMDPEFRTKVTAICELYRTPPSADEVVLCIDEKPGMQALERKHPARPAARGRARRREFEYKRHGTQTLLAAFDVHTGKVFYHCGDTREGKDLVNFMHDVAAAYPNKKIKVIWDCLNIHFDGKAARWTSFNAAHDNRFFFTYTPKHASWVNQIECFFSILQRNALNRGSFVSTDHLRETVSTFISHWNEHKAHPFRWTFTGYPLRTGVDAEALAA